ncbi:MAG: YceI family protein, partial [Thermoanaerobaculia bacterium]|nr:YceI family protein [Thermoanaerobaculia bacterium]
MILVASLVGVWLASVSATPVAGGPSETREPPSGRYEIRSSDSYVGYRVYKLGMVPIRGQFGSVRGEIVVDPGRPERSRAEVTVSLASLESGKEERTETLLSEDFFHADRFPEMRFLSRRVRRNADGRWLVSGDLTIRGVTRTVTVPVEIRRGQGLEGPLVVFS